MQELKRACDAGAIGVMVLANIGGRSLTDPAFADIWKAIDDRRLPVLVHPTDPPGAGEMDMAGHNPSLNVKTLADLVALARRDPNALVYGSAGNGSPQHLIAEMFKAATDVQLRHVPYKGSAPAITDLVGGQIGVMFSDFAPALPHVRNGRLAALAVTTSKRQPAVPDVGREGGLSARGACLALERTTEFTDLQLVTVQTKPQAYPI